MNKKTKILTGILVIIVLAGGILAWQYFKVPKEEVKAPEEVKMPEEKPIIEEPSFSLVETKLAIIPKDHKIVSRIIFSPDGRKVAYIAEKENKYLVAINGKEGQTYDQMIIPGPEERGLQFSPDSQIIAYPAKKGQKWFMVVNDKEGKPYDKIGVPVFSPNSKQLGYVARKDKNLMFVAVINGKEGREYDYILTPKLKFAPDGKHIAYGGQSGNELWWVVDEVE